MKKEKEAGCETNPKVEKYCFVFGAIMAVLSYFIIVPFIEQWLTQKEQVFQKDFFSRYHNYDEIVDDYFPDEKISVKVEEYPSGKILIINYGEKKYFVNKQLKVTTQP